MQYVYILNINVKCKILQCNNNIFDNVLQWYFKFCFHIFQINNTVNNAWVECSCIYEKYIKKPTKNIIYNYNRKYVKLNKTRTKYLLYDV